MRYECLSKSDSEKRVNYGGSYRKNGKATDHFKEIALQLSFSRKVPEGRDNRLQNWLRLCADRRGGAPPT